MKRGLGSLLITAVLALLCLSTVAQAQTITCKLTGIGSGTLNGVEFWSEDFTITTVGDISTRTVLINNGIYFIDNTVTSIEFKSLDFCTFATPTRTFCNAGNGAVGLSRGSGSCSDLFDIFDIPGAQNWNMLISFGPANAVRGQLTQWNPVFGPINTSRGVLEFKDSINIPSTFAAQVVPEPCSIFAILTGVAGLGTFTIRRRKLFP